MCIVFFGIDAFPETHPELTMLLAFGRDEVLSRVASVAPHVEGARCGRRPLFAVSRCPRRLSRRRHGVASRSRAACPGRWRAGGGGAAYEYVFNREMQPTVPALHASPRFHAPMCIYASWVPMCRHACMRAPAYRDAWAVCVSRRRQIWSHCLGCVSCGMRKGRSRCLVCVCRDADSSGLIV